jgi:hypothetical protein
MSDVFLEWYFNIISEGVIIPYREFFLGFIKFISFIMLRRAIQERRELKIGCEK